MSRHRTPQSPSPLSHSDSPDLEAFYQYTDTTNRSTIASPHKSKNSKATKFVAVLAKQSLSSAFTIVILVILFALLRTGKPFTSQLTSHSIKLNKMSSLTLKAQQPNRLAVATWNIAAVNNNPFEYWITMKDNPAYNKMMNDVELFIESPDEHDISVSQVFTSNMYNKLESSMQSIGRVSSSDLAVVKKVSASGGASGGFSGGRGRATLTPPLTPPLSLFLFSSGRTTTVSARSCRAS